MPSDLQAVSRVRDNSQAHGGKHMKTSELFISSLEKGLVVLEAFRHQGSMNLTDIARSCGMTSGSAQRVAHTLEQLGYLCKDQSTRRYRLSVKALGLGYSYLANEKLLQTAHSIVHQLHQQCGESVNVSVPEDSNMVFVMRLHSYRHIPVYMPIGTRIPLFASASGRAVLASVPTVFMEERLKSTEVAKHTPRTTTDKAALRRLIVEARTNGYAYADEEFYHGDLNVAAAVMDEAHNPVAALSISVPKPRWSLARARHELGPLVVRAARAIGHGRS